MYTIKWEWGHYVVRKGHNFICSADTYREALQEIEDLEDN